MNLDKMTTPHESHKVLPINQNASRYRYSLSGLLDQLQIPSDLVLMSTALLVGLTTGIGAVLFRYLIRGVEWVGYTWIPAISKEWGIAYVVFVPAVGGLLVGLLVYLFAREAKGHGVPEVMEAVALRGGRIRPVVAVVKSLASAICIGSGGSVGREGPIVQIGSALGSSIGQALKLSDERVSNLVACGAAGGIAATFNAPIAGVIFALEVIMGGRFSVRYFSSVVVSAVTASVIGRVALGDVPAFAIPFEYGLHSLWEFLLYPVLGVLAAVVGVFYTRIIYGTEDLFDSWKRIPEWVKPAIGGTLLGGVALAYPLVTNVTWTGMPQVYNVGYDVIESVLANELALSVAFTLLLLKLIATSLTLGSGGSGGVFAPSLFIGAMLGGVFAQGANSIFPNVVGPEGAYALVGMGAVFAAIAHAPMTAVLILFELTNDYRIILPLMLTVVVATVLSQQMLRGESIYTLKLTRRGVRLRSGRDVDVLQSVTVGEVMTPDMETVSVDASIDKLAEIFTRTHRHGLLVLDKAGMLWGIVTISDLDGLLADGEPHTATAAAIGTTWPYLQIAYPDETMGDALTRMGARGIGRLPVVAHEDPYRLLGLIRSEDIIRAYDLALTRRTHMQQRTERVQLQSKGEMELVEIPLAADDAVVGKTLQEIAQFIPKDSILVSIKRDERIFIPHGNTEFQAGDHVTAYVVRHEAQHLFQSLHQITDDSPA